MFSAPVLVRRLSAPGLARQMFHGLAEASDDASPSFSLAQDAEGAYILDRDCDYASSAPAYGDYAILAPSRRRRAVVPLRAELPAQRVRPAEPAAGRAAGHGCHSQLASAAILCVERRNDWAARVQRDLEGRQILAMEAEYYMLDELAAACRSESGGGRPLHAISHAEFLLLPANAEVSAPPAPHE